MPAIQFTSCGEPESVLSLADAGRREPESGEVRVRMLASPINPSDLMFIRGGYTTQPRFPQTAGFEGVGVVEASGGGLKARLFLGKRVIVAARNGGTWASEVIVPAGNVIPASASLTDEQAATFLVNPATAWLMTQHALKLHRGDWLLQTAANSTLGQMIIRLGNVMGFQTVNVVRSDSAAQVCHAAGARHVIVWDSKSESPHDLVQSVRQLTGNSLTSAIDPVGGTTAEAALQCLAEQGRLLLFGSLSNTPVSLSSRDLMTKNLTVRSFWLGHVMQSLSFLQKLKLVRQLTKLISDGTLQSEIAGTFLLQQWQDAVRLAESSHSEGKVLFNLRPQESDS